jgi:DNA-binding NarL/FixJ family response regulator
MKKTTIMIVDDHPIVRQGLMELLNAEPDLEVTAQASNAATAMEQLDRSRPDLIIIDLSLSDASGIDLIKQIKARDSSVRMLVSSMHDEKLYAERCLHAGAMGYVSKEAGTEKILTAVRRVLAGKVYLSPQMSEHFLGRMVHIGSDADRPSVETLSDRELEVFELIGRGMATRKIAESLNLSMKTIETYRENIKVKLGLQNSTELIRHAVQWWESH